MFWKQQDSRKLAMKKLTRTARVRILYHKGMIDSARLGRMITMIENLTEAKQSEPAMRRM